MVRVRTLEGAALNRKAIFDLSKQRPTEATVDPIETVIANDLENAIDSDRSLNISHLKDEKLNNLNNYLDSLKEKLPVEAKGILDDKAALGQVMNLPGNPLKEVLFGKGPIQESKTNLQSLLTHIDSDKDRYPASIDCNDKNPDLQALGFFYLDTNEDGCGDNETKVSVCAGISSTPGGYSGISASECLDKKGKASISNLKGYFKPLATKPLAFCSASEAGSGTWPFDLTALIQTNGSECSSNSRLPHCCLQERNLIDPTKVFTLFPQVSSPNGYEIQLSARSLATGETTILYPWGPANKWRPASGMEKFGESLIPYFELKKGAFWSDEHRVDFDLIYAVRNKDEVYALPELKADDVFTIKLTSEVVPFCEDGKTLRRDVSLPQVAGTFSSCDLVPVPPEEELGIIPSSVGPVVYQFTPEFEKAYALGDFETNGHFTETADDKTAPSEKSCYIPGLETDGNNVATLRNNVGAAYFLGGNIPEYYNDNLNDLRFWQFDSPAFIPEGPFGVNSDGLDSLISYNGVPLKNGWSDFPFLGKFIRVNDTFSGRLVCKGFPARRILVGDLLSLTQFKTSTSGPSNILKLSYIKRPTDQYLNSLKQKPHLVEDDQGRIRQKVCFFPDVSATWAAERLAFKSVFRPYIVGDPMVLAKSASDWVTAFGYPGGQTEDLVYRLKSCDFEVLKQDLLDASKYFRADLTTHSIHEGQPRTNSTHIITSDPASILNYLYVYSPIVPNNSTYGAWNIFYRKESPSFSAVFLGSLENKAPPNTEIKYLPGPINILAGLSTNPTTDQFVPQYSGRGLVSGTSSLWQCDTRKAFVEEFKSPWDPEDSLYLNRAINHANLQSVVGRYGNQSPVFFDRTIAGKGLQQAQRWATMSSSWPSWCSNKSLNLCKNKNVYPGQPLGIVDRYLKREHDVSLCKAQRQLLTLDEDCREIGILEDGTLGTYSEAVCLDPSQPAKPCTLANLGAIDPNTGKTCKNLRVSLHSNPVKVLGSRSYPIYSENSYNGFYFSSSKQYCIDSKGDLPTETVVTSRMWGKRNSNGVETSAWITTLSVPNAHWLPVPAYSAAEYIECTYNYSPRWE